MRQFERRAAGKPVYYKLAKWDGINACWSDGKKQFDSETDAKAAAVKPGLYRISAVNGGREDLEPFDIQ